MIKSLFRTTYHSTRESIALLILRLGVGVLMLTHGWPKLMRLMDGGEISFPDPLGMGPTMSLMLAAVAEVGASILIMLGLATRLASFFLAFTMAIAVFVVHANDPFSRMELGLIYLLIYIYLMITGPGKFSIDSRIR